MVGGLKGEGRLMLFSVTLLKGPDEDRRGAVAAGEAMQVCGVITYEQVFFKYVQMRPHAINLYVEPPVIMLTFMKDQRAKCITSFHDDVKR